ncbi:MAG: hypothetical protein KatS3mg014_1404 [Actinomycetota bacterium]|nr:MAG: hypothetical protein KatS3mg014_1404 [Actinomycetota bacterium]
MQGRRAVSVLLALVVGSLPCPETADAAEPVRLRVMTFNIWYGATATDLSQVIEAIRAAGADVVGLQEPYARLRRIARALGFHAAPRMHVISRYPILEPEGSDGWWAYLWLGPGRVAAIANTHLSCCPYTPYRIVHRGIDRERALEIETNTRLRQIARHLDALGGVLDAGIPTFFTGDFNAPSWRDWTREAVDARGLPYPVRWPVSLAMEAAGFVDPYRVLHPDPVADPGFTWTPGYPAPYVSDREVHDRIDFVWAAGARPVRSQVVGESRANADVVVRPWPSDHRAVVTTFDIEPVEPPTFVASNRERSRLGGSLPVWFHGTGADRIALVPSGAPEPVAERAVAAEADGRITFPTEGLAQGAYDLLLLDGSGGELARDRVVLVEADQPPVLRLADRTLQGDQPLQVSWAFAPGNRFDWLGVYRAGVDPKRGRLLAWRYTRGTIEGETRLAGGVRGSAGWPLPTGRYELHLCLDDSYRCRTSVPFRVLA